VASFYPVILACFLAGDNTSISKRGHAGQFFNHRSCVFPRPGSRGAGTSRPL